ncbi:3-oxoacyl-ACP reductase family protein [Saccharomonospora xinjiangensis]|uniref:3-oxoacyl-ACP reductase family protein n=1 Tax=Saccharomonospora xinjiangensis TaxID=75294 RepID=UPI0010701079|nr:3-oxoacyl-ACP reductase family protein [Saccharomonospora xinjiangensis]QBQ59056.1 Cyclic-di-GMP-binding biofilm dispersal mediator protein [Saccharomonospora xinjiangensis]
MSSNRIALVTGGSRGIGAATALRLADDGMDVAITYASSPDRAKEVVAGIEERGRRGLAIEADSADADAVVGAVDRTVAELGGLDVLVNNAGIIVAGPLSELTLDDIDRTLSVNVRAVLLASQAAAAHLPSGGRIISIGSNLATHVPGPGMMLYAASKSALIGMTKGLARELGPRGITANIVAPGSTDTDMNPADGPMSDAQRSGTALGRYNHVDDIAAAVSYLAGDGGRNVTGTTLLVDAGTNA